MLVVLEWQSEQCFRFNRKFFGWLDKTLVAACEWVVDKRVKTITVMGPFSLETPPCPSGGILYFQSL